MEVPCLYEFKEDSFSINWACIKIECKKISVIETCKEDRR